MEDEVVTAAMQIIMKSGDARVLIQDALDAVSVQNFQLAKEKLVEGQKEMTAAHSIQTDMIQGEARGESRGYSLLFTHAQDTLMTIYSELYLSKKMVSIFESYEARFQELLNKFKGDTKV